MKKKRNHNLRLVKIRRSYSIAEIAHLLNVHVRTVQTWHLIGLKPIEEISKPLLFMGAELKRFLSVRLKSRRCKLQADEFYCPRCKAPRNSQPDHVSLIQTGKKMGRSDELVIIKGKCEKCGSRVTRFCTEKKVYLAFPSLILQEGLLTLKDNNCPALNADNQEVKSNEK